MYAVIITNNAAIVGNTTVNSLCLISKNSFFLSFFCLFVSFVFPFNCRILEINNNYKSKVSKYLIDNNYKENICVQHIYIGAIMQTLYSFSLLCKLVSTILKFWRKSTFSDLNFSHTHIHTYVLHTQIHICILNSTKNCTASIFSVMTNKWRESKRYICTYIHLILKIWNYLLLRTKTAWP